MPRIELLIVQPTPFCNINCAYCYLPNRTSRTVVSEQTLIKLFSQVFASGWVKGGVSIVWHAGEPLVLPVEFYRRAFAIVEQLKPKDLGVQHAFQTNGTLINETWCQFLAAHEINIGVSIDGPRRFHNQNRRTRAGKGTFDRTIAGVRLLRKMEIPFHVISVLSPESMAAPREMFEFYVMEGIKEVCFNVEESEGGHLSRSFAEVGIETAFYRFLHEFWKLSSLHPGAITFIREIEHAISQVIRPSHASFSNTLVEPFAVTSMDCEGNISTFSPELLGLKNAAYGDYLVGNINRGTLAEFLDSANLARMQEDIGAGVRMCRECCQYFSVCGGGEPVNKLAENGTFASTETSYCRLTKMRTIDLVLDAIESMDCGHQALGPEFPGKWRQECTQ